MYGCQMSPQVKQPVSVRRYFPQNLLGRERSKKCVRPIDLGFPCFQPECCIRSFISHGSISFDSALFCALLPTRLGYGCLTGVEPLPNVRHGVFIESLVKILRDVGDVWRCQDVVERPEGVIWGQRLNIEYVDRRPSDLLVLQHPDQLSFFDDWPARRIDQPGGWLHSRQLCGANQAAGSAAKRHMDRQEISLFEQLLLGNQGCAHSFGGLGRYVLAPGNQVHSKSLPNSRDL